VGRGGAVASLLFREALQAFSEFNTTTAGRLALFRFSFFFYPLIYYVWHNIYDFKEKNKSKTAVFLFS